MCGITGFFGPYNETHLAAMTRAVAHRGPDDVGTDLRAIAPGATVGLGHRRLSIIDLADGHQPMWTSDGRLGIVFNGEIYNYRSLRSELESEGARFRTNCDTEVILEGWRLRGKRILPAMSGMFALALWDEQAQSFTLARDHCGIKPLYYHEPQPGELLFASEIKPLLPFLDSVEPNLQTLYEFLLYSWTPGPETIFKGIRSLPPGTWAVWSRSSPVVKLQRYVHHPTEQRRLDRTTAAGEFREIFHRAIQRHLVADVPVGINLSGGLDSSAVLATMAQAADCKSIDAFTIGFGLSDDETPYARKVAKHTGANHHVRIVSPERVARDFSTLVCTIEEPIAHPMLQTTFETARLARERVKVVMIGEGADEMFLGYPQYRLLQRPFRYAPRSLLQRAFLDVSCLMPRHGPLAAMLEPDLLDGDVMHAAAHRFDACFRQADVVQGGRTFEFDYPLVANQLMRIDKLTMAFGLEARVPYLDRELVDWSMSLPLELNLDFRQTKAVLRAAMAADLPHEVVQRPKTGKGGTQALLPYLDDLLTTGPLSDLVSAETIRRRGWLNAKATISYLSGRNDFLVRSNPIERRRRMKFLYALAVLEQWAREFVDHRPET